MTSPMVDTVRNIPLIVERDRRIPMDEEMEDETGFPFDREERVDDDSFQSQLDDLAKRHPEFAEHFGSFPFREGGSSSRPRREHPEFRRFTDRPFGQRFERFGFPSRDLFHENFPNSSQEQPQQPQQPQAQQAEATHSEAAATAAPPSPKQEEAASKPPEVPQENRRRQQNIQQSNTVDLGQKQEPVNDRNQRSMSAPPPDSRGGQQRFVSSIQIPINSGGMGDMGGQQSTHEIPTQTHQQQSHPQQPQQDKAAKPMERVIPIHVEGRDEPVMPKHQGPTFAQQQHHPHQPQPETIFGQRPGKFTQYVPRQFGQSPFEDPIRQQQQHYQQQPQQKFQQQQKPAAAPHPQKTSPQPQPQPQAAQPSPPPQPQRQQTPPQQPKPQNPIDIIQLIQKDVSELMSQVEKFEGQPRDKQYLYLDEMLTRNLLKLDNVDTQGQENIRSARKEAIRCIERCIGVLEAKAAANVPKPEQMEVETKAETQSEEPTVVKSEEPNSSEEAKSEPSQEQMEVAPAEKPADEPQAPKAEEESMEVAEEPDKKKKSKQKNAANE